MVQISCTNHRLDGSKTHSKSLDRIRTSTGESQISEPAAVQAGLHVFKGTFEKQGVLEFFFTLEKSWAFCELKTWF